MALAPQTETTSSGWAPLRHKLFRDRWIANIVSNLGSWMQDTAGTWLMTILTSSPLLIALMQTAASFPVLVMGVLAGATADIFDRRRLLLFWQAWMLITVAILTAFSFAGYLSPWALLGLTFFLNIGSAMSNPAWQAIVPELVPRDELPDAIAINSAGFNLARAVGPALGGLAVGAFASVFIGAGSVFLFNSLSFLAVIWVLYRWKRTPLFKSALPAERLFGSVRAGLRYVRHAPVLLSVFTRGFLFTLFSSAVWALLAVVAHRDLSQGAMGYGVLNGCLGAGAVMGAATLPRLRKRVNADTILAAASVVYAMTLLTMAFSKSIWPVIIALLMAGFSWTSTTSTLNVSVQLSVPAWVQARALGSYQMVFQGGMAIGSALWGFVAEHTSTNIALVAAAVGMVVTLLLVRKVHLPQGAIPDLHPFTWRKPIPTVALEPRMEDGPVMVQIEYHIQPQDIDRFSHAIHEVKEVRLRDGAFRWGIFQDTAHPERFVESFLVESWIEYLRQRERMTAADRRAVEYVRSIHSGEVPPSISHMIYARESA